MDIPAILDVIRPGADWGSAATYEQLVATWRDQSQQCPTEQELEDAWPTVQAVIADAPKTAAKAAIASVDPSERAIRARLKVMAQIQAETRARLNAIATAVLGVAAPTPLVIYTAEQLIAMFEAAIDAE